MEQISDLIFADIAIKSSHSVLLAYGAAQSLGWQLELSLRQNNPLPLVADFLDKNSRSLELVIQKKFAFLREINVSNFNYSFFYFIA